MFVFTQTLFCTLLYLISRHVGCLISHPSLRSLTGCSLLLSSILISGSVVITLVILLRCPPSLHLSLSSHRDRDPCTRWCCVSPTSTETAPAHPHACQTLNLNRRDLPTKTPTGTTDENSTHEFVYLWNCCRDLATQYYVCAFLFVLRNA